MVAKVRKWRNSIGISLFCFPTARLARIKWWYIALHMLKISFQQGDVEFHFFMCCKTGGMIIFLCHGYQNGFISTENKIRAKNPGKFVSRIPKSEQMLNCFFICNLNK